MKNIIKLCRFKHSIKNSLIFLPLFFSGRLLETKLLVSTIISAIAFTFVCSFVYIFNDLQDIEKDRNHPTKCTRPLASGAISLQQGKTIAWIMITLGYAIIIASRLGIYAIILVSLYIVLNILYSSWLKNVRLVDIIILTSGFILRVLFGSAVTNIPISNWMYLTIFFASLFMALGKRRNELRDSDGRESRTVLKKYNYAFLDKWMYVSLSLALMCYSLWAISEYTGVIIISIPIVVFICMLYSLIVEGGSQGDPVEVILSNPSLIILGIIWGVLISCCLYL